ncbi:MAG TPA: hypothetical protein VMU73_06020 [Gaiellaceae bacterium]|nr:hypothetical protein [Gaiellaceae bacterium]
MQVAANGAILGGMERSLAVVWTQEHEAPPGVGKLQLLPDRLHLEGRRCGSRVTEDILLREIRGAHLAANPDQRIGGRATLVIQRLTKSPLLVSAIFGFGALAELADRITL